MDLGYKHFTLPALLLDEKEEELFVIYINEDFVWLAKVELLKENIYKTEEVTRGLGESNGHSNTDFEFLQKVVDHMKNMSVLDYVKNNQYEFDFEHFNVTEGIQ
ncbi:hypothetical protein D0469_06900 [Peribacillus saganii]|uniref:Uncharacterized protein n=1 Tax=Peribacillus saganii TaxID=2303992 RepID=A0A372LQ36_9BACI|nr:hypothetical protein [Peribacillus saganii]RFU70321.1 hypothetical protein D0469_06900 [Peribacillus saganii]